MQLLERSRRVRVHPARTAGHPHGNDVSLESTRALQLADRDGHALLDRVGRPHADEDADRIANLGVGPVIREELIAARHPCGEVATPQPHRLPRNQGRRAARHGLERRLIDAGVRPLVERLVDDVRGHDHLAADQADERDGDQDRGRQRQPRRQAPPGNAVCGTDPASDRCADPDHCHSDDDREKDHRRAFPPGQVRHTDEVAGLVLPGSPGEHPGDTDHERHHEGRDRYRANLGPTGRPTGDAPDGSLGRHADAVADRKAGAARHALDNPAAGNERGGQRDEPEDEARSKADGAGGASDRPHAHQAISSISRQRSRCDADAGLTPSRYSSVPIVLCGSPGCRASSGSMKEPPGGPDGSLTGRRLVSCRGPAPAGAGHLPAA